MIGTILVVREMRYMKKTFSDLFTVPEFLEMRPAGLAISERAVHLVEFVKKNSKYILGRHGTRRIPAASIKEGYINDKNTVITALKSLQNELGIEFVMGSLPEEKVYLFKTELPMDAAQNIGQAIELRMEENIPLRPQDALFDYSVVFPGDGDKIKASVSAAPSKMVDTYLEVMTAAGFRAVSLGVESEVLSRAVIPRGSLSTYMIVNIGESRTCLSIISNGKVAFSLAVAIGGDAFTNALQKHFSVGVEEALKIKEERGFVKNRENMELFFSLMNAVSSIRDEVNKLSMYWQTHGVVAGAKEKKIEKIILCGRDSSLIGFDEYLSLAMKTPVEIANVWQNAFSFDDNIPTIPFLDSLDYASAIGMALPE